MAGTTRNIPDQIHDVFYGHEYMHIVTISSVAVTLFFGGGTVRVSRSPGDMAGDLVLGEGQRVHLPFFWIRASLPRLRYDQLMNIG